MSRRARRIVIPLVAALAMLAVVVTMLISPRRSGPAGPGTAGSTTSPAVAAQDATNPNSQPSVATQPPATLPEPLATQPAPPATSPDAGAATTAPAPAAGTLRAIAPDGPPLDPSRAAESLGSLDPRTHRLRLDLTRLGAGISAIPFSDLWNTAAARRQAARHFKSLSPGQAIDDSALKASERYILQTEQPYAWGDQSSMVPIMAAHSIIVDGQSVGLLASDVWRETAPGVFESQVVDGAGSPLLHITRQFTLGAGYDIALRQRVRNLTDRAMDIRWRQYGPVDLKPEGYIDRRRVDFGYQPDPAGNPQIVLSRDGDVDFERGELIKQHDRAMAASPQERKSLLTLWPNRASTSNGYGVSWVASSNRYFGLAVHPIITLQGQGDPSLRGVIEEVRIDIPPSPGAVASERPIFTFLASPVHAIAPGAELALDVAIYAGPLDRHILNQPAYAALGMDQLILYEMSGCCTFLTFQWLAHILLWFLAFLHDYIVFDWGMAIIGLVIVVRALLHPLTRKSQINMQRFGKQMSAMKPEIDKIQKKYKDDPKKAQAEQMRLMREQGVNPLQMLGCLPMFLQMPIWIALWAMLYLAFDIRQEPAFYGVFQLFNGWSFLGDLSSQDNFIPLGSGFTIPLVGWSVTAINLLPLLMGVVFYIQQKYMSPPPTPNMTPEQVQQQKIMKVMMVVMFPLMLYIQPSGLTLYICTSTIIGIIESKYIRAHITELELNPPKPREQGGKPKDLKSRLFAEAIERAKAKRDQVEQARFKKRK